MTLKEIEKNAILAALRQCHWRRRDAAKILGVTQRTIENKIALYRREGTEIPLWRDRRSDAETNSARAE